MRIFHVRCLSSKTILKLSEIIVLLDKLVAYRHRKYRLGQHSIKGDRCQKSNQKFRSFCPRPPPVKFLGGMGEKSKYIFQVQPSIKLLILLLPDRRCAYCARIVLEVNKKLSYRREIAHLTSLYRRVQKALWYVEPFKGAAYGLSSMLK